MTSRMHITAILLKNYRQFRNFHLDLVEPNTSQPLEKVCFIGSNGTGKSTLLALVNRFLQTGQPQPLMQSNTIPLASNWDNQNSLIGFKVRDGVNDYFVMNGPTIGVQLLLADVENTEEWSAIWNPDESVPGNQRLQRFLSQSSQNELLKKLQLQPNSNDLAVYAPPDGSSLLKNGDLPNTNLSSALGLFNQLPAHHTVSYEQLESFWNILIYQIKKRESDFQQFLKSVEAQTLSVAEARRKFDTEHPEIMVKLAEHWNLILEQAGLEFDSESAQIPIQLNQNLQAFVRLKATKTRIPYNMLSTGVRNFIFRFGHIFTLFFNRTTKRGFLLIDEPEASLFPDLAYDIIDRYQSVIHNTQFFVATHSPIIASQFRPCERIILAFDDQGHIHWQRGISPEGDDPNDLLMQDFEVRNLYGRKGLEQWERYRSLHREILSTTNSSRKKQLLDEYTKIGNAYNFPSHEVLN